MSKFILNLIVAFVFVGTVVGFSENANACPMCKTATEDADTDEVAGAYMTSILFMLAVPTVIFTGIGATLYGMSRREEKLLEELEASLPTEVGQAVPDNESNPEQ